MRLALVMVAVAALAFAGGYEFARRTVPIGPLQEELAAIRGERTAIKERPTQAAAAPQRRRGPDPAKVYTVDVAGSASKGASDAKVTIVEFSDFQCPYCSRVGPTLARILRDYPDDVRVVYKHLPLSFHKEALPAAKAAEAAGRQGKFWEMHDLIFANQRSLNAAAYKQHAETLGLDVERFEKDFASPEIAARVAKDAEQARTLGVSGTPGFFVNGRFLSGAQPYDAFKTKIDEVLKAS